MNRKSMFVILFVLFFTGFLTVSVAKAESGLPFDTQVSGTITEQKPADEYTIVLEQPGTLSVTLDAYFSAVIVDLQTPDGNRVDGYEVTYNGRSDKPSTYSKEYVLESGEYTLIIKDHEKRSFGDYEIRAAFDPANNNEIEPNQSFNEAMLLTVGGDKVRGFISLGDQDDYYKVELTEPGRFQMNAISYMPNANIRLFDERQKMIAYESFGFKKDDPVYWKHQIDLEAGIYYILVTGQGSYRGVYEMGVDLQPANNEEKEPNNTRETAIPLQLNDGKTHTGFLSDSDKIDYYALEMNYDGYMTINFTSEFSMYNLMREVHISYGSDTNFGAIGKPVTSTQKLKLEKGIYYFSPFKQVDWQSGVYTMSFSAEPAFMDMTDRYSAAVTYLADKKVAKGISKTEFGMKNDIKRVDAAIWLANILNLDTSDTSTPQYGDVPKRAWGAVNALRSAGIATGKSSTYFGANDTTTRGEMALLIQRAYTLSSDGVELSFKDVSPRYEEAVKALLKHNVTQGKTSTKFGTGSSITRGELAIFLYRVDAAR
ncbi:S-layer homology domain-containing protein [Sporosarcina jeotgali]|uniref:S-layer homology domain-containing protein n=1 Tax=Sporosarcina jeotgali TaxID=3020056 RepID=A0ABZ0KS77_9BACL|nr:S-layer homology domain-containing protein [Sporosarcina sp. B2O-1]WOV83124.1 S-layer homology domain-containing protein [Sporosarcina sp. B2O-1]